jgi:hypothetical protein
MRDFRMVRTQIPEDRPIAHMLRVGPGRGARGAGDRGVISQELNVERGELKRLRKKETLMRW